MSAAFKGAAREIGGRRYVLVLNFNHLCDLSLHHPAIMSGVLDQQKLADPIQFRSIFHRALGDQIANESEAGDLITALTIPGAGSWLGDALAVAFGTSEGETVNPSQAQPQP